MSDISGKESSTISVDGPLCCSGGISCSLCIDGDSKLKSGCQR